MRTGPICPGRRVRRGHVVCRNGPSAWSETRRTATDTATRRWPGGRALYGPRPGESVHPAPNAASTTPATHLDHRPPPLAESETVRRRSRRTVMQDREQGLQLLGDHPLTLCSALPKLQFEFGRTACQRHSGCTPHPENSSMNCFGSHRAGLSGMAARNVEVPRSPGFRTGDADRRTEWFRKLLRNVVPKGAPLRVHMNTEFRTGRHVRR